MHLATSYTVLNLLSVFCSLSFAVGRWDFPCVHVLLCCRLSLCREATRRHLSTTLLGLTRLDSRGILWSHISLRLLIGHRSHRDGSFGTRWQDNSVSFGSLLSCFIIGMTVQKLVSGYQGFCCIRLHPFSYKYVLHANGYHWFLLSHSWAMYYQLLSIHRHNRRSDVTHKY